MLGVFNREKKNPATTNATGSHLDTSLDGLMTYHPVVRVMPENFKNSFERYRLQGFPVIVRDR